MLLFQKIWGALLRGTLMVVNKTVENITHLLLQASLAEIHCSQTKVHTHSSTKTDNITFNILCQAALTVCVVCNRLFPDSHSFVLWACHLASSHADESPEQITPQRKASTSQPALPWLSLGLDKGAPCHLGQRYCKERSFVAWLGIYADKELQRRRKPPKTHTARHASCRGLHLGD